MHTWVKVDWYGSLHIVTIKNYYHYYFVYHTNYIFLFHLFAGYGDSKSEDIGEIFFLNYGH